MRISHAPAALVRLAYVSRLKGTRPWSRDLTYRSADALFWPLERRKIAQNRNLTSIPGFAGRKGGTDTLSEWAYTIGLFQAVVHQVAGQRRDHGRHRRGLRHGPPEPRCVAPAGAELADTSGLT